MISEEKEAAARIADHMRVHQLNEPRAVRITEALDLAVQLLNNYKRGEWKIISHYICECPFCNHKQAYSLSPYESGVNFCEKCGADLNSIAHWDEDYIESCGAWGYRCSRCWKASSTKEDVCPHCGVYMSNVEKKS